MKSVVKCRKWTPRIARLSASGSMITFLLTTMEVNSAFLICLQVVAVAKEFNVKRRYNKLYIENMGNTQVRHASATNLRVCRNNRKHYAN